MDINEATAKALQAARAVSGLTYEEVSEKSGVSVQTIYRMFGAKRDIKVPQLYSVAKALGLTLVDVVQDAERIQIRDDRKSDQPDADPSDDFDIEDMVAHPEKYHLAANIDNNKDNEQEVDDFGA